MIYKENILIILIQVKIIYKMVEIILKKNKNDLKIL